MGVWQFDGGTWSQNTDGIVTMESNTLCASIINPPLEINVVNTKLISLLPQLKTAIQEFLRKESNAQFPVRDFQPLLSVKGKYELGVDVNLPYPRRPVSRNELESLIPAIDRFLADPSERNCRMVPMQYKKQTFLLWLNCSTPSDRSLDKIHKAIDKPKEAPSLHSVLITADQFDREVKKPYPFLFYPEMNKITGAE
jgi:hypothetical protein